MSKQRMNQQKIFIIGLPRTATTSVCVALLEQGFTTAHTAYTKNTFIDAQVMADTPIYADYQKLDRLYPQAKFVLLERNLTNWLPSIKQLLLRMSTNLLRTDGGFNPHIKRCFTECFSPFTLENINDDEFLTSCFLAHKAKAIAYFKERANDFISINVEVKGDYQRLLKFVGAPKTSQATGDFKKINIKGKVTAWNDIKSINKIASTNNGRIDKLLY